MSKEQHMLIDDLDLDQDDDLFTSAPAHDDNADTIVDPKAVSNKPGRVINQATLTLHTKLAHRLFYGRKKSKEHKPIIGLVRFASYINTLSDLAAMDDPYADAKLLEIENCLNETLELINLKLDALRQIIDSMDDIQIKPNFSVHPVKLELEFRTKFFGFHAARILKRYDNLVLLALSARQVGYMLDSDWLSVVGGTATKIRRMMLLSAEYRFAGANRDDMAANNQKARDAIAKYGELPQDILEGKRRSTYAPNIQKSM